MNAKKKKFKRWWDVDIHIRKAQTENVALQLIGSLIARGLKPGEYHIGYCEKSLGQLDCFVEMHMREGKTTTLHIKKQEPAIKESEMKKMLDNHIAI